MSNTLGMIRPEIDYRDYDPAKFVQDHPEDPVVLSAQKEAQELSKKLSQSNLFSETEIDRERMADQYFSQLADDVFERRSREDANALRRQLEEFKLERIEGIHEHAMKGVMAARTKEGQVAAWEGTPQRIDRVKETAQNDPDYLRQREQLEQFQAARQEVIGRVIDEVRTRFHGRDRESGGGSHPQSQEMSQRQQYEEALRKMREPRADNGRVPSHEPEG